MSTPACTCWRITYSTASGNCDAMAAALAPDPVRNGLLSSRHSAGPSSRPACVVKIRSLLCFMRLSLAVCEVLLDHSIAEIRRPSCWNRKRREWLTQARRSPIFAIASDEKRYQRSQLYVDTEHSFDRPD